MDFRKLFAATALCGLSFSAVADHDNKFYAGSGAGIYYIDFDDIDYDESATAMRVFGGYQWTHNFAIEAGFTNMFESSADVLGTDVEIEAIAWDVSVRPSMSLSDNVKAYAILGWTSYDFEVSASLGPVSISDSDKESDMLYGFGASMNLNDAWDVRGEWVNIDVEDADFGTMSVSATYQF